MSGATNIILSGGSGCRKKAKTDCGGSEKKPKKTGRACLELEFSQNHVSILPACL